MDKRFNFGYAATANRNAFGFDINYLQDVQLLSTKVLTRTMTGITYFLGRRKRIRQKDKCNYSTK